MYAQSRRTVTSALMAAQKSGRCAISSSRSEARLFRRRVSEGELVEPHPGLFAHAELWTGLTPTDRALHVLRAIAVVRPEWVFSHHSAAAIHGLYASAAHLAQVHVTSPYSRTARNTVHHIRSDVSSVTVDGMRVTPLEQTVFDCLKELDFRFGLAIADSGCARLGVAACELVDLIRLRWKGCKGLSRALATAAHADARSESGGESVARAVMIEEGFQLPDLQVEIPDPMNPAKAYRVDFLWKTWSGELIAGELDGMVKYRTPRFMGGRSLEGVLLDERERESRLSAAGIRVVRFKYSQVLDTGYFARLLDRYGVPRA